MDMVTSRQVDEMAATRAESRRLELEKKLSTLEPPATQEEVDFIVRQQSIAHQNILDQATGKRSFQNPISLGRGKIANPDAYLMLRRALDPASQNKVPTESVSTSQE